MDKEQTAVTKGNLIDELWKGIDLDAMGLPDAERFPSKEEEVPIKPKFDPSLGQSRNETQARLRLDIAAFKESIRVKYGRMEHLAIKVDASATVSIKKQNDADAGNVYGEIISRILTAEGAMQSQADIRRHVQPLVPSQSVPRDWNKPLPVWAVRKVQDHIFGMGAPMSTIRPGKGWSLNDLHKAARTAVEKHKTGCNTYKVTVTLTDETVIVNGTPFRIGTNKVAKETYPQLRVPMRRLIEAITK